MQTSPMDCGPASLKCLLEGFGIPVAYGRLREAVQTDVDGTSIDALTEVARSLGLDASQILVPVDHVAHSLSRTLPAVAVVTLPSGANHFVVVWRRTGRFVQVMDPAAGRVWLRVDDFRRRLYVHGTLLPAAIWRRFAGAPHALRVLEHEIARLGHRGAAALVAEAARDESWRSLAALEAATRMVRALLGSVGKGAEAGRLLESLYERGRTEDPASHTAIPPAYWSARPGPPVASGEPLLFVRGALLVRVRAALAAENRGARHLSPELAAAIGEPPARPLRSILREIAPRERRTALAFAALTVVASAAVLAQAVVFQGLFALGARFSLEEQRLGVVAALIAFSLGLYLLELPVVDVFLRLGRSIDARWRAAFQEKIPLLPERWFASRPSSDMAERAHGLSVLRGLPALSARALRTSLQLIFTAGGLVWLDRDAWPLAIAAALAAGLVPFAFQPALHERELSLRNHHGALARFYLETLLGLVAVRVHGAERRIRGEHEGLLVEWLRSGRRLARAATASRASVSLVGFGTAALLVADHLARHPANPGSLLFAYWALSLPALGDQLSQVALQLPAMRNATLRALEPISAPREAAEPAREPAREEEVEPTMAPRAMLKAAGAGAGAPIHAFARPEARVGRSGPGLSVELRDVVLKLGGHPVLEGIDLELRPGEHVALVGRSGAGKSSLIGLLLGFHRASEGRVAVEGERLDARTLASIRRATAWLDPATQIWNQSLFENLVYGVGHADGGDLAAAIGDADLRQVLESLPQGLSAPLGEGGGFLSGGEGQRVRLARTLLRPGVRLALLDEPFRGLDRATRRNLLARARERWSD
ncbi:MAG: ATP-binding cassette domain-containing protein, partial [Planctomycetota bacterium]